MVLCTGKCLSDVLAVWEAGSWVSASRRAHHRLAQNTFNSFACFLTLKFWWISSMFLNQYCWCQFDSNNLDLIRAAGKTITGLSRADLKPSLHMWAMEYARCCIAKLSSSTLMVNSSGYDVNELDGQVYQYTVFWLHLTWYNKYFSWLNC